MNHEDGNTKTITLTRRRWTKAEKEQFFSLYDKLDCGIREPAKRLGIPYVTATVWVKAREEQNAKNGDLNANESIAESIRLLIEKIVHNPDAMPDGMFSECVQKLTELYVKFKSPPTAGG